MSENDHSPDAGTGAPLDDESIARAIESAGPRPPIPRQDLAAIAASARAAWQARRHQEPARVEAGGVQERPWPPSRTRRRAIAALALAAAFAALLLGARAWWLAREDTPSMPLVWPVVATVELPTSSLRVEVGGVERPLAAGDVIRAGAAVVTAASDTVAAGAPPPRGALRLQSGAVIRMDAGTTVRLASPTRIDLLAGAIYADTDSRTAAAEAGPRAFSAALEIHTSAGMARDIGTRFMAKMITDSGTPALAILVRDGAVAVERDGESETAHGGERILARAGGAIERGPAPTFGPEWAWVLDAAPPFEVAGRSVADILDWVARETGWEVRYEDATLAEAARKMIQQASREETGGWRADQAPFLLLPGANLEGELEAGVLTVKRR